MTDTPHSSSLMTTEQQGSIGRRLAALVWNAMTLAAQSLARRRARRELLEMPDFLLKDMGISRSEVPSVVHYGLDDASRLPRGYQLRQGR
jgi:uncharacterized protein YjiS (DUF1127 family)